MRRRTKIKMIIVAAVVFTGVILVNGQITTMVKQYAAAQIETRAAGEINGAIYGVIGEHDLYGELIQTVEDAQGRPVYMKANTANLNRIAAEVVAAVQERMNTFKAEKGTVWVPLGSLTGSDLFAGRGPKIRVEAEPDGQVSADFQTVFEESGINQTRHKIYLTVRTEIHVILPTSGSVVPLSREVLVCDTVVLGSVPETYVDVQIPQDTMKLIPIQ